MSQEQVYNELKKSKRGLTVEQLSKKIGINKSSVSHAARRLLEWGDITQKLTTKRYHATMRYFIKEKELTEK